MRLFLLCAVVCFVAGCATSFKYQPRHDQTYPSIANNLGVEIIRAEDVRNEDEKLPHWNRKAEVIVARAAADELQHAGIFRRVKIHLSGPKNVQDYSHLVELRVKEFRYYNPTNMLDYGRQALHWLGVRGSLIERSIPRKYISEVSVEFEVIDPRTMQTVFRKTYSDTRSLTANGYEGTSRQVRQTSDALETVVKLFAANLVQLPTSQRPP